MPLIAGFGMLIHTKSRRTRKTEENTMWLIKIDYYTQSTSIHN